MALRPGAVLCCAAPNWGRVGRPGGPRPRRVNPAGGGELPPGSKVGRRGGGRGAAHRVPEVSRAPIPSAWPAEAAPKTLEVPERTSWNTVGRLGAERGADDRRGRGGQAREEPPPADAAEGDDVAALGGEDEARLRAVAASKLGSAFASATLRVAASAEAEDVYDEEEDDEEEDGAFADADDAAPQDPQVARDKYLAALRAAAGGTAPPPVDDAPPESLFVTQGVRPQAVEERAMGWPSHDASPWGEESLEVELPDGLERAEEDGEAEGPHLSVALELEVHPSRRAVFRRNADAVEEGGQAAASEGDASTGADEAAERKPLQQESAIDRLLKSDINHNPQVFRASLKARYGDGLTYELVVRTFGQLRALGRTIESVPYEQSLYLLASVGRVEDAMRLLADLRSGTSHIECGPVMYQRVVEGCQYKSGQVARVLEQMAADEAEFSPGILNAVVSVMYRNKASLDEIWAVYKIYVAFHEAKAAAGEAADAEGGTERGAFTPSLSEASDDGTPAHKKFSAILEHMGKRYHRSLSADDPFLARLEINAERKKSPVKAPKRETYSMLMNLCRSPQDVYRVATAMYAVTGDVPADLLDVGLTLGCNSREQAMQLLKRLIGIAGSPRAHYPAVIRCTFKDKAAGLGPAKDLFQRSPSKTPDLYAAMIEGVAGMVKEVDDGYSQLVTELLEIHDADCGPSITLWRRAARILIGSDPKKAALLMNRYNEARRAAPAPEDALKKRRRDLYATTLPSARSDVNPFLEEYGEAEDVAMEEAEAWVKAHSSA
eukprot:TRINITY_DN12238_c0_g4_i1.p1 TRINITY_DN12238_c0_g4~~TRINITY_DN12238_c0_g4_i1.p1  ORF type:complete len:807 (+),score=189.62 TRINITY_DN12238_c0_g4_i1:86-2422(+)